MIKSPQHNPLISVVVCTRNRGHRLNKTLDSYLNVVCSVPWELVIVDNASTDETRTLLDKFSDETPLNVVVMSEPMPGLSRARNRGIAASRGEIIAFTDDDCYPDRAFVSEIARAYENHEIQYTGGRVLLHDETDLPVTIQLKDRREVIPTERFIRAGFIHGANMSFRKNLLQQLGGFDERLGAGTKFCSGEDTDLIRRASSSGALGIYEPQIVVEHDHGRKTPDDLKSLRRAYAKGRGACFMKFLMHPKSKTTSWKQWYWHLRQTSWRLRLIEIGAGFAFLGMCNFSSRRAWSHPHHSMGSTSEPNLANAPD